MEFDDLSQSGIRRVADYSPYLDQLAGLASEMGLKQRSNLVHLERCLHMEWSLGQNSILSWTPTDEGLLALVVPHYAIAEYMAMTEHGEGMSQRVSARFVTELISGDRQLTLSQMHKVATLLKVEPKSIALRQPLSSHPVEIQIVEKMIRRYGINYVASRAVTLFDIVGFSLLTPFEQMTQLNSLSYSLNSAHAKMLELDVGINFARSSSGDGFYIWNRDQGLEANVNLYHFMHIVLADNAIARSKTTARAVPRLKSCFHVGSCYEFHQAEGLNPTTHDFIVGDVTIELARMIDAAMPGQILVGEFVAEIQTDSLSETTSQINLRGCFGQRVGLNLRYKFSNQNLSRHCGVNHASKFDGDVTDNKIVRGRVKPFCLMKFVATANVEAGLEARYGSCRGLAACYCVIRQHDMHEVIQIDVCLQTLIPIPDIKSIAARRAGKIDADVEFQHFCVC